MKKILLFIFIIIIVSCERAPLIKDYKIEEIGLGDSLLKLITVDEIEKQKIKPLKDYDNFSPSNKYKSILIKKDLKTYYEVEVLIKPDDKEYITQMVAGRMSNINLDSCLERKLNTTLEFSKMFKNSKKEEETFEANALGKEKTTIYATKFYLDDGLQVIIQCYHYPTTNPSYNNHMLIVINKKEVSEWLSSWE